MNSKVIKSAFMLVISTCFCSLCLTFAWFTSNLVQQNKSDKISLTGMDGDLYYYDGNHIDSQWCGFLEDEAQAGLDKQFIKYDPESPTFVDPFQMQSAKPSSRFLFYIDAKVKDTNKESFTVQFGATDWICEPPVGEAGTPTFPKDSSGGDITLTRAIHVYIGDAILSTSLDEAGRRTQALTWCDSQRPSVKNNIYEYPASNKFKETTARNTGTDAVIFKADYTFAKNEKYMIPFIIEFTDDPTTFYDSSSGSYQLSETGDSNVYMGMRFTFTEIFLTHIDPPKPEKA